ncbi:hypothetical protein HYFRA_00005796 [Hymenoscyphus fraxineus]|uniref:THUMP domain-containing protein n=1 Tax=Hymenoscyphus fraxineus TaxID=746836 RepID=A0A9N9KUV9_9HELO|nr:hypothetical protein HYFRA_00005796 [Hymenoscyphus fraxineus]
MSSNKRKEGPNGSGGKQDFKRSKGGSGGKWKTPNHKAKDEVRVTIAPGDIGIWATCARGQEGKATTELKSILYQFAEKFYGLTQEPEDDDEDGKEVDIEASIQKEAAALTETQDKPKLFSSVRIDIECVLFFKVQPPIDPVDFVHRICLEIASKPEVRLTRYVNRLTPMTLIGKATEKGLAEVGNTVLSKHFQLNIDDTPKDADEDKDGGKGKPKEAACSYAIRPTIRNHTSLKRGPLIEQIASSIKDIHPVNLTKPDKVIIVEIYQTVCGMSVVGGDWESLKRYNLSELYQPIQKPAAQSENAQRGGKRKEDSKDEFAKDEGPKVEVSIDTATLTADSSESK